MYVDEKGHYRIEDEQDDALAEVMLYLNKGESNV